MTVLRQHLGKWMSAERLDDDEWVVRSIKGDVLGGVVWFARWRQFEFEPIAGAAFSWDCLKALSEFLVDLNKIRRETPRTQPDEP